MVYQSLEFDLIVYAPYRSVEGIIQDMEESSCGFNDDDQVQKLKHSALMEVDMIMLTDAPLLLPPGQLALAALRRGTQVHRVVDFDRYLACSLVTVLLRIPFQSWLNALMQLILA
ncbi:putative cyclin [Rosa chinensis]|uniref:Putative cyclin n=1 Tax=Rosa chinensis TaxID=74649 RepID=A0A2P6PEJ1_ROSCH|nr:putative cyclin [Rosa chinensis]